MKADKNLHELKLTPKRVVYHFVSTQNCNFKIFTIHKMYNIYVVSHRKFYQIVF